jgi:hypothetical protein
MTKWPDSQAYLTRWSAFSARIPRPIGREWLARDAAFIRAGDDDGLAHFPSAFGGMGSLNDVLLRPRSDDDWFYSSKEDAWTLATTFRREEASNT